MVIEYDDNALDIMEKVNEDLRKHALEFVMTDEELDAAVEYVIKPIADHDLPDIGDYETRAQGG